MIERKEVSQKMSLQLLGHMPFYLKSIGQPFTSTRVRLPVASLTAQIVGP